MEIDQMFTETKQLVQVHHVTVMHAIQSFLKIALQGKSPHTKKWYSFRLDVMARALGETTPLMNIQEIDLIRYRDFLERKSIAPDTLHGYIRAARRLFKWLYKRGMISADITTEFTLPKLPKRGKKGIADNHAALILEDARRHSARDYALISFLESTGCRRGGLSSLRLDALNLTDSPPKDRRVQVIEKGNKQRTVFMSEAAAEAVRAWLNVRVSNSQYVFTSEKGKPLNSNGISEVIDRYKKRLGIKSPCSPHQWHHRWFRKLISKRMPLAQAAQIGGHTNTNITFTFYGQFATDELQEAFDRYYPA
jgi:site-specific recombinase XerD